MSLRHCAITVSICGRASERARVEAPHLREGRIAQPQPAVAGEHRDRFAEIVERFALHADQRVEAAFEIEPLGHVVEQIGDAAFGIGRGDDAQACGRPADAIRAGAARPPDRLRAAACATGGSRAARAAGARRAGGRARRNRSGVWSRKAGVEIPQLRDRRRCRTSGAAGCRRSRPPSRVGRASSDAHRPCAPLRRARLRLRSRRCRCRRCRARSARRARRRARRSPAITAGNAAHKARALGGAEPQFFARITVEQFGSARDRVRWVALDRLA